MSEPIPFRYCAFLSYSHRDSEIGESLHRALERYRVPHDLVGRPTSFGRVPAKLSPIFRDRYDLEAGHSLGEQVLSALKESEALIVVCSPASAKSRYVNGEIVSFKQLGRAGRIFPIIVGGEPGHAENECFPPALRRKVLPDGTVTSEPEEPLAADARLHGDGPELARLKLIAGLMGVDLDELRRREAEYERQRKRVWIGVAASMAVLAMFSIFQWRTAVSEREQKSRALVAESQALAAKTEALEKSERLSAAILDRASSLVNKAVATTDEFGVPTRVGISILDEAEGIFSDMDRIGAGSDRLATGRARMLLTFSDSLSRLGKVAEQKAKVDDAVAIAAGLLAARPDDKDLLHLKADALLRLGYVHSTRHELTKALEIYEEALALREQHLEGDKSTRPEWLTALSTVHNAIAVAQNRSGEAELALYAARRSATAADRLAALGGQDLAASEKRVPALIVIADMYRQLGRRQDAFDTVTKAVAEVDRVLAGSADNVPWVRRKSHLVLIEGDVHRENRDYAAALASYERCFEIRERLHKADVQNATLTTEASYSRIKIGEAQRSLGRLDRAEEEFTAATASYEAIIALNPDHKVAARQLVDALDGVGDIKRRKKLYPEMMQVVRRKQEVASRILEIDRDNREAQRLLARVEGSVGDAFLAQGDTENALTQYRKSLAMLRALKHPSLTDERTLAEALENLGTALYEKRQLADAADILGEAVTLRRGHAERAKATDGAKLRWAGALQKLAEVSHDKGTTAEALGLAEKAVAIRLPLLEPGSSAETQRLLAQAYEQVGRGRLAQGDAQGALAALEQSLPMRTRLSDAIPADAHRRSFLAETWRQIGEVQRTMGDCKAVQSLATSRDHLSRAIADAGGNSEWSARLESMATAMPAECAVPGPATSALPEGAGARPPVTPASP